MSAVTRRCSAITASASPKPDLCFLDAGTARAGEAFQMQ